jgi:hypothetical protein
MVLVVKLVTGDMAAAPGKSASYAPALIARRRFADSEPIWNAHTVHGYLVPRGRAGPLRASCEAGKVGPHSCKLRLLGVVSAPGWSRVRPMPGAFGVRPRSACKHRGCDRRRSLAADERTTAPACDGALETGRPDPAGCLLLVSGRRARLLGTSAGQDGPSGTHLGQAPADGYRPFAIVLPAERLRGLGHRTDQSDDHSSDDHDD